VSGCFSCSHCGLHDYNADLNANKNLAHPKLDEQQALVNVPITVSDEGKASPDGLRLKITASQPTSVVGY
jgi:hypothetical protein